MAILLTTFTTTLAIANPPGVLPVFLSITQGKGSAERAKLAAGASITMLVALGVVAIIGTSIFSGFGISIPALQVGGGILVLIYGLQMATGKISDDGNASDGVVVPIGIPILAGPGAITVVLLNSQGMSITDSVWLLLPLGLIAVIVFITLFMGEWIARTIKETGVNVITRVMGLIITTIACQLVLDGLRVGLEIGI